MPPEARELMILLTVSRKLLELLLLGPSTGRCSASEDFLPRISRSKSAKVNPYASLNGSLFQLDRPWTITLNGKSDFRHILKLSDLSLCSKESFFYESYYWTISKSWKRQAIKMYPIRWLFQATQTKRRANFMGQKPLHIAVPKIHVLEIEDNRLLEYFGGLWDCLLAMWLKSRLADFRL